MHMRVHHAWQDGPAVEIDHFRFRPTLRLENGAVRSHRNYGPGSDGNRLLNGEPAIDGDYLAVVENKIGIRRENQRRRAEKHSKVPQHFRFQRL